MKKWSIILLIIVAVLGFGYISAHKGLNKPDEILIRELFVKGEQSVETKDLRGAMSCISPTYKGQFGGNYDGLRLLVGQAFRSESNFDIQMDAPKVTLKGDDAVATSKVTITNTNGREQLFSNDITVGLKKETERRYFIFPVKVWKVNVFGGVGGMQQEMGM